MFPPTNKSNTQRFSQQYGVTATGVGLRTMMISIKNEWLSGFKEQSFMLSHSVCGIMVAFVIQIQRCGF